MAIRHAKHRHLASLAVAGLVGLWGCQQIRKAPSDASNVQMEGDVGDLGDSRVRATMVIGIERKNAKDPSKNGIFWCTGVAVSQLVVLTAAHCVENSAKTMVLHHQGRNGDLQRQYEVKETYFAGDDDELRKNSALDLAVLVLASPLDPAHVSIARLPNPKDPRIVKIHGDPRAPLDCRLLFAGVGCGNHDGLGNFQRRMVIGSNVLIDGEFYSRNGGPFIAMGPKTACGDSGGPLFTRDQNGWSVIGTLVGLDRDPKGQLVSRYVPILDHLDLITDIIRQAPAIASSSPKATLRAND